MGRRPSPANVSDVFCTSLGISTTTGPGRPLRAISNAVRSVASRRAGSVSRNTCLAHALMMLLTGASWKASLPKRRGGHLAADHHHRHRVGHGVAHRRDHIGGAGTGGDDGDAHLARRARIAGGHETRALFVCGHDQRHRFAAIGRQVGGVVAEDRVVHRQDRAARIAEQHVDAFIGEYLHDHLRTAHGLAGERVGGVRRGNLLLQWQVHDGRASLDVAAWSALG